MITFLISWNFRQNHSFNSTAATWPNCLARLYLPATLQSDSFWIWQLLPVYRCYWFYPGKDSPMFCMPRFRIARDPNTAAALADPYLGQSIGPVPGYGVSFCIFVVVLIVWQPFCFYVFARKKHASHSCFVYTVFHDETKLTQIPLNWKYLATFWTLYYN